MAKMYQTMSYQALLENTHLIGALYSVIELANSSGDGESIFLLRSMVGHYVSCLAQDVPDVEVAPKGTTITEGELLVILDNTHSNTIGNISKESGVPTKTLKKMLDKMVNEGKVRTTGFKRGMRYYSMILL